MQFKLLTVFELKTSNHIFRAQSPYFRFSSFSFFSFRFSSSSSSSSLRRPGRALGGTTGLQVRHTHTFSSARSSRLFELFLVAAGSIQLAAFVIVQLVCLLPAVDSDHLSQWDDLKLADIVKRTFTAIIKATFFFHFSRKETTTWFLRATDKD